MRFGLFHTIQGPEGSDQRKGYEEAIEEAVHADVLGMHAVWLTEHHFSSHGIISDNMSVLAYLAGRTSSIRLGTAVTVLPFHNPVRAAETAATVDILSGGRLDFGIGRGYQWNEFNRFGLDMAQRSDRFDEAIEIIIRSWTARSEFEHRGRFWSYGALQVNPKPIQHPHPPVWVATDSEDGLRRCAREGWGVMLPQGRTLATLDGMVKRYRRILDEEEIPFDANKLVVARALFVADSDEEAWEVAGMHYLSFLEGALAAAAGPDGLNTRGTNPFTTETLSDSVIFGSPESCVEQLHLIAELGIDYVLFFTRFGSLGHEEIVRTLDMFASEVAPSMAVSVSRTRP